MMTQSALELWNSHRLRIGYSHSTMTNDERMQRESSLIATIRRKLPDFAKACADEAELVLLHQDAFAADYQDDEYLLHGDQVRRSPWEGSACDWEESANPRRRRHNPVKASFTFPEPSVVYAADQT
jgi:hypothetical protein